MPRRIENRTFHEVHILAPPRHQPHHGAGSGLHHCRNALRSGKQIIAAAHTVAMTDEVCCPLGNVLALFPKLGVRAQKATFCFGKGAQRQLPNVRCGIVPNVHTVCRHKTPSLGKPGHAGTHLNACAEKQRANGKYYYKIFHKILSNQRRF